MSTDSKQSLSAITLTTIGVVYSGIGTSLLYTFREYLSGQFGFGVERNAVLDFLPLIFWLLIFVVSIRYLAFVIQVSNTGEEGILTLISLAGRNTSARTTSMLVIMGLIGGNFLYGGAVVAPTILVMSATEGLEIATLQLDTWIASLSVTVLALLFMIQKHDTAVAGKLFAPTMLTRFLILTGLELRNITTNSEVLHVLNPVWTVHLFLEYKMVFFIVLGAVVLSIMRIEALYADMGHFDKLPIRLAWSTIVLPSLTFNYSGQGALLSRNPEAIKNPLFLLAPGWALVLLLTITALATVITSRAAISGVFSLTRQAVHLGYLSSMRIIHVSEMESGQIYTPFVNRVLYVAVVVVIVGLEHSNSLAATYGIVTTGTVVLTSILLATVARQNWHWNKYLVTLILIAFLYVDIPLLTANLDKLFSGNWLLLNPDMVMFVVVTT